MAQFKSPKAIYMRIEPDLHYEVKKLSVFQHKTLEKWCTEAIIEKLMREKAFLANNTVPE